MNCNEARDLIAAALDGELDLVRTLDLERHIHDCRECAAAQRSLTAVRGSIQTGGLYFRVPAVLEQSIRAQLRLAAPSPAARRAFPWRPLAIAAVVALVASSLWAVLRAPQPSRENLLAMEVRSSHVRSLMADRHLLDVESSDQHTVKPWFDGKLDFAPDVRDLASDGFPLIGGRLDYLAGRPVAALVYRHEKHTINLFLWPTPTEPDRAPSEIVEQGYVMIHWTRGGMTCWAISDASVATLRRFAQLIREGVPIPKPTTR